MKNWILFLTVFLAPGSWSTAAGQEAPESARYSMQTLVDFGPSDTTQWYIVNDGVMGGISSSAMQGTDRGTGLFSGDLSLENNGGFASVRAMVGPVDLSASQGLELRVKGDGRTYQLRLRTSERFDGVAYRSFFETTAGQWTSVVLPFAGFEPTFRGRVLADQPQLDTSNIVQLAFMLADKQAGPFQLEVDHVVTWRADGEDQ
jgi:hypothetical protein